MQLGKIRSSVFSQLWSNFLLFFLAFFWRPIFDLIPDGYVVCIGQMGKEREKRRTEEKEIRLYDCLFVGVGGYGSICIVYHLYDLV